MSMSFVPIACMLYFQIDAFCPNVCDLLFGVSLECHVKAIRPPHSSHLSLEYQAMKSDFYLNWEWRQFGLLMCSWVVWLCYMSLYWILDTTPYSVFYVAPTVWLIDLVIVTSSSGTALDSDSARFRPFAAAVGTADAVAAGLTRGAVGAGSSAVYLLRLERQAVRRCLVDDVFTSVHCVRWGLLFSAIFKALRTHKLLGTHSEDRHFGSVC